MRYRKTIISKRYETINGNSWKRPSLPLQNDVIQCTEELQLKDQKKDKIAKLRQNKKLLQQEYEDLAVMHHKQVMEKDEEFSRLKDHVEKLIAQVKKTKVTKKELKKHLSEQEGENLRLKNLNKNLLEQIRDLKDEKLESQNI